MGKYLPFWKPVVVFAVVGVLTALLVHNDRDRLREEGARAERDRQAAAVVKHVKPEVAKAETVFVRDTVRLWKIVTRWDTAYVDVVKHLTDTVYVKAALATADSAIKACSLTVLDCGVLRARQDTLIQALTVRLANAPRPPSGFQRVETASKTAAVSIGLWEAGKAVLRVVRK